MANVSIVSTSPFPQTSGNRTRAKALAEIASFYGGEGRPSILARAGAAWESAIREYNTWLWKFNRITVDITLASPDVANGDAYTLPSDFAEPNRAKLVGADGYESATVTWVPFAEWLVYFPERQSPSSGPIFYTAQNVHENGQVTIFPRAGDTLSDPTMRLYYFRRIVIPSGDENRLNVPMEVDEGIFQLAQAKMTHKQKSFGAARAEYDRAIEYRIGLEHRFRDFPDME